MSSGRRTQPAADPFDGISNLPASTIIYSDENGIITSLIVGNNLQINNGELDVVLAASVYDSTYATNIGTGYGLYSFKDGDTLKFKSISGSSQIVVTEDSDNIFLNIVNAAEINHLHFISEVVGLQNALDGLAVISHLHDDRYSLLGHTHAVATTLANGFMSAADFTKLSNIETEATKNATDAYLLDLTNHTGTISNSNLTSNLTDIGDLVLSTDDLLTYDGSNIIAITLNDIMDNALGVGTSGQFLKQGASSKSWVDIVKNDITDFVESAYVHTSGDETILNTKTFNNIVTTSFTVNNETFTIGDGVTGSPSQNSGLFINRGTEDSVFLFFDETLSTWGSKIGVNPSVYFSLDGHTHTTDDITDITITTPISGNVLKYTGSAWVNTFSTFLELSDTPSSYSTNANKIVTVNAGGTGLGFTDVIDGGTF